MLYRLPATGQASELTMKDSLVSGNRFLGLLLYSSKATLERSVVQDTLPQLSNKNAGAGIEARAQSSNEPPSELILRECLVARNHVNGVILQSSKGTISKTVVRDTKGGAQDPTFGTGIEARYLVGINLAPELSISDSLVHGNIYYGVLFQSAKGTLERTVVRDNRPNISENEGGVGVAAVYQSKGMKSAEVLIRDSAVAGNRRYGIYLMHAKATLERVVVRDTRAEASDGLRGTGIGAQGSAGLPMDLSLSDSLVLGNRQSGVIMYEAKTRIQRSVIADTQVDGKGEWGDAILGIKKSTLDVEDTLVRNNARAGIIYVDSAGSVYRSSFRENVFPVNLELGANPKLGSDNELKDNQVNRVTVGQGLKVPAIPDPPKLPDPS